MAFMESYAAPSLRFLQPLQHLLGVAFRFHFVEDVFDPPIRPDDECRSGHAHHLLAIHVLFLNHAIGIADSLIGIGDQRKRQVELVQKLLLIFRVVGRDAEHNRTDLLYQLE